MTVNATVMNNGTAPALDVVVRFEDVTAAEPVLIGKQRLIDSLLPGEDATVQVTYDTTDKAGERRIQVTVDPAGTIAESDEQDNSAIVPLVVAPPPAPNLVVASEDISFSPSTPSDGQPVTITVAVSNDGARNAGTVEVRFVDATNGGEAPIGDVQVIGSIPSGGTATAQVTYDTTGKEGERTIRVVVDPNNLVTETDETDNEAEATLTVAPPSEEEEPPEPGILPNLVITSGSLAYTPTMPVPGDWVTLTISVTNDGEGDASGVVVRVTDTTEDEPAQVGDDETIPTLASGAVATVTVPYSTTGVTGTRTLSVTVDPDEAIEETSETDNEATITIPLGDEGEAPPGEAPPGEGEGGEDEGDETPPDDEAGADGVRRTDPDQPPLSVEMAEDLIRRPNDNP